MGRQAHHHFIPSSYLKGFTQDGEDSSPFWGVPINNNEAFPTKPTDACSMRDYYTIEHDNSLIVEHWYANKIEPKINIALQHIKEHSKLPLLSDMPNLILLLATLYVRTPSHRETVEAPLKRTKKIVDSMCEDIKVSNRHEFEYTKTDLINSELKLIDTVIKCLNNKYYKLYIINDSEHDVITSDNPFILSHPNGGKEFHFGLNTPNIEICVPITRQAILVASNEPFEEGVFSASDELVGLTNTKLILSAKRFFYSSKPEIVLVDDDINVYKHTICSNNAFKRDAVKAPRPLT
jgi:hypothetical protein